jgi:hypothetical protein
MDPPLPSRKRLPQNDPIVNRKAGCCRAPQTKIRTDLKAHQRRQPPEILEQTRRITRIVLDKTGTITEGRMELADVVLLNGASRADVLRLAGAVESASEHPIAWAVAAAAKDELGVLPSVADFTNLPGIGVLGHVDGHAVEVGRRAGAITVSWDGVERARLTVRDTVKPFPPTTTPVTHREK